MTDTIVFDSTTPRFVMPLLYAGQAQKEVFVNESLSIADALLHCAIESEAATPPPAPNDGQAWLIAADATGVWAGKTGMLACRQGGQWFYIAPRDGMRVVNKTSEQDMRRIAGVWRAPDAQAIPTGGGTIDAEARSAISGLIQKLRDVGIFALG